MKRLGLVLILTGCFGEPARPASSEDGGPHDADVGSVRARVISTSSSYVDSAGDLHASGGMTATGWSLDTTGVQPGELMLIIGNLDNGWELVYGDPIDAGWTTIGQKYIAEPDGQTLIVASKVAGDAEPDTYAGTYSLDDAVDHRTTSAAAMALVAITGGDAAGIESAFVTDAAEATTIIRGTPPGITTTAPDSLVLFVMAIDWVYKNGVATFTPPTGFAMLAAFTDKQNDQLADNAFRWTTEMIATRTYHAMGDTGPVQGITSSIDAEEGLSEKGVPLMGMLAIRPIQ